MKQKQPEAFWFQYRLWEELK